MRPFIKPCIPAAILLIAGDPRPVFADDHIRIEPRDHYPWAHVEINHVHQPEMGGGADPGCCGVSAAWITQGSGGAFMFEPSIYGTVTTGQPVFTQFEDRRVCLSFDDAGCTVIVTQAGCGLDAGRLFSYLDAFFAGDPGADFNRDASVTVEDVFDYLAEILRV